MAGRWGGEGAEKKFSVSKYASKVKDFKNVPVTLYPEPLPQKPKYHHQQAGFTDKL